MRKFFGLKFLSSVYKFIAILIALFSILWAGLLAGDAYLTTKTIQVSLSGDWSWWLQAVAVLIIGGLLGLTFFVLAEIIDAILANYDVSNKMLEQFTRSNDLNEKLIASQQRLVKSVRDTEPARAVKQQLSARKASLQAEDDVFAMPD